MAVALRNYISLAKVRLSLAVALSAVTGYFIAGGTDLSQLIITFLGVIVLSGGSAALNQYTESDIDLLMERTRKRPLPSGIITKNEALRALILLIISGLALLSINGLKPALLGLLTLILYNFVYTPLKKKSIYSVVPGALVGAIPPLIGASSAGASLINRELLTFSLFIFLWQLPHFWLIVIKYGKDYNRAGFETLAKHMDEKKIRNLIFSWVLASTLLLFTLFTIWDLQNPALIILFALINLIFILLFRHYLFSHDGSENIKFAFILINSFSLIIMALFIAGSVFGR